MTYVTDRNGSSVNTAESISNHSTSNEAGTSWWSFRADILNDGGRHIDDVTYNGIL